MSRRSAGGVACHLLRRFPGAPERVDGNATAVVLASKSYWHLCVYEMMWIWRESMMLRVLEDLGRIRFMGLIGNLARVAAGFEDESSKLCGLYKRDLGMATLTGATRIGFPNMKLIRLKGWPILQQLHLEESLFRTSSDNVCVFNDGTNVPSIVMGASGKLAELVELKPVLRDQVPVIRRFSGGGTVIVDKDTVFVTFICNKDAIPGLQPYPRPIMSWSSQIYDHVFDKACNFQLRENDYVFGKRKFGGNAQSITKRRWIHHTSFLWDYKIENMAYLKLPTRAPEYRRARSHTEFICRMKDYLSRSEFIDKTISALGSRFSMEHVELEPSQKPLAADFVPSSREITMQEMEEALAELASEEPAACSLSK